MADMPSYDDPELASSQLQFPGGLVRVQGRGRRGRSTSMTTGGDSIIDLLNSLAQRKQFDQEMQLERDQMNAEVGMTREIMTRVETQNEKNFKRKDAYKKADDLARMLQSDIEYRRTLNVSLSASTSQAILKAGTARAAALAAAKQLAGLAASDRANLQATFMGLAQAAGTQQTGVEAHQLYKMSIQAMLQGIFLGKDAKQTDTRNMVEGYLLGNSTMPREFRKTFLQGGKFEDVLPAFVDGVFGNGITPEKARGVLKMNPGDVAGMAENAETITEFGGDSTIGTSAAVGGQVFTHRAINVLKYIEQGGGSFEGTDITPQQVKAAEEQIVQDKVFLDSERQRLREAAMKFGENRVISDDFMGVLVGGANKLKAGIKTVGGNTTPEDVEAYFKYLELSALSAGIGSLLGNKEDIEVGELMAGAPKSQITSAVSLMGDLFRERYVGAYKSAAAAGTHLVSNGSMMPGVSDARVGRMVRAMGKDPNNVQFLQDAAAQGQSPEVAFGRMVMGDAVINMAYAMPDGPERTRVLRTFENQNPDLWQYRLTQTDPRLAKFGDKAYQVTQVSDPSMRGPLVNQLREEMLVDLYGRYGDVAFSPEAMQAVRSIKGDGFVGPDDPYGDLILAANNFPELFTNAEIQSQIAAADDPMGTVRKLTQDNLAKYEADIVAAENELKGLNEKGKVEIPPLDIGSYMSGLDDDQRMIVEPAFKIQSQKYKFAVDRLNEYRQMNPPQPEPAQPTIQVDPNAQDPNAQMTSPNPAQGAINKVGNVAKSQQGNMQKAAAPQPAQPAQPTQPKPAPTTQPA